MVNSSRWIWTGWKGFSWLESRVNDVKINPHRFQSSRTTIFSFLNSISTLHILSSTLSSTVNNISKIAPLQEREKGWSWLGRKNKFLNGSSCVFIELDLSRLLSSRYHFSHPHRSLCYAISFKFSSLRCRKSRPFVEQRGNILIKALLLLYFYAKCVNSIFLWHIHSLTYLCETMNFPHRRDKKSSRID